MVARFDTKKHEINLVSIPRDAIINVDWEIRKINAVYAGSLNFGGTGIDSLMNHVQRYIGFEPDYYAVLNIDTFMQLIDEVGGVDFDVPEAVDYGFGDVRPGLYITLSPGPQHLNGEQAMAIVRNRVGYEGGDLRRIEIQHAFLKACLDQFLSIGTIPHVGGVLKILGENLKTDLSAGNIAWFLSRAMSCRGEDIHFYTMPSDHRLISGYSYLLPSVYEWLKMINDCLSPFEGGGIGFGNLDVVYCDESGRFRATSGGLSGPDYYDEELESSELPDAEATPSPLPSATPEPGTEPAPESGTQETQDPLQQDPEEQTPDPETWENPGGENPGAEGFDAGGAEASDPGGDDEQPAEGAPEETEA